MMTRLILTCLLLLPAYSAVADNPPTSDQRQNAGERSLKIAQHFHQLALAKEWDAAEALALGAQQMFEENHGFFQSMVDAARRAKGLPVESTVEKNGVGESTPSDSVVRLIYRIADLPVWDPEYSSIDEQQLRKLATESLSPQDLEDFILAPYPSKKSVVIQAKRSAHAKVQENFRQHSNGD